MSIKAKSTKWAIMALIYGHKEGLGFGDIANTMKSGKGFKTIKSRNTISKTLKQLAKEDCVTRDIETRKYVLTKKGQQTVEKWDIIDEILACPYLDTYSDWVSTSAYLLIDAEKDGSDKAIMIPYKRLKTHGLDWTPEIKGIAQMEGLDYENQKEKVWETLFKGVRRFILIYTVDPWALLKKLKLERK